MDTLQEAAFHSVIPQWFATPFYRDRFRAYGVNQQELRSLSDISRLPFSTKQELRQSTLLQRTPFGIERAEYLLSSSGSSGVPTVYMWTRDDSTVLHEAGRRAMKRIGVDKSDMAMTLTPQGMSVMSYCMVQQYSAIGAGVIPFGVGRPDEILDAIVDLPVSIVISLPIALARLAEYGVARRGAVASGRLRQLHCGGDFLSDAQRQRLETSWGVPCFNFYGLSEVFGPIAGECLYKNGMHFLHDYVYVEVLDPVTRVPVAEGQPGVAVYTTLWAKGSPVVRYWSDDYVRVDYAPCPCGDQSPRLHFIGRPLAMLENAGRRVFARELEEQILRFSVSSEYALNVLASDFAALTVEVLPDHDFDPVELRKCIEDLIGMKLELNLVNVGTLPRIAPKPQRIIHDPTPRG